MARTFKLLIAAALIALVAVFVWRGRVPSGPDHQNAGAATPARGGTLIASIRSEPGTYNRYAESGSNAATELVTQLTQARLVRVNRATDDLEPWLAESWTTSADGRSYTLTLRDGLKFSDGESFTSADVLFAFQAAYDPNAKSSLGDSLLVDGKPLAVSAPDARTVVVSFPAPFAPGLRLLDDLPILPRHKLADALADGRLAEAWTVSRPLSDLAGMGPFVLKEHIAGQRLVFERNPFYFRKDAAGVQLPYLEGIMLRVASDQPAETLRLRAGEIDVLANAEVRPEDYAGFKSDADAGRVKMTDVGVSLDADLLWFNLAPGEIETPGQRLLAKKEFRQAIDSAIDRQAIVDTVYLGAAVPIAGPVTPGNRTWYDPNIVAPPFDQARARALLAGIGLADRNGDGMVEDETGVPARFSLVTQAGHLRARVGSSIVEQLRQVGIGVDLVTLDAQGLTSRFGKGDYDAIYFGVQTSSTDPAQNREFWLSRGRFHFWRPGQEKPATPWEAKIDDLIERQNQLQDLTERKRLFSDAQRLLLAEDVALYFVAPKVTVATSARVLNVIPALRVPQVLWNADALALAPRR